jgi:subtilisin family serine protease
MPLSHQTADGPENILAIRLKHETSSPGTRADAQIVMENNTTRFIALIGFLLAGITSTIAWQSPSVSYAGNQWKLAVDQSLLIQLEENGQVEFIISLREQADLSAVDKLATKSAKGAFVYDKLSKLARRTQGPIISELKRLGASYQSFWVANMIWVKGDPQIVQQIARRADVAFLHSNPKVRLQTPFRSGEIQPSSLLTEQLWNLELIRAPEVWALGINGNGIVVGGQDTGYDWQHKALKEQYRGWDGITVDHNYNWHDAIHDGSPLCGPDSEVPCDGHGHGTHTMGTILGDDGQGLIVGVAPGSSWIGCRNMNDSGQGTPVTYIECYQWFIAPTNLKNQNENPAAAPDVINNSWSCPIGEGCTPNILFDVVENVRAAGILTVHSAGNSGPVCGTVNTPAAIYDASFTAGATTREDIIWRGSSRGPVLIDNSQRLKPDISAPGQMIYSSWPNDTYTTLTGTSMAAPHVVGTAALLMESQPSLIGYPKTLESILAQSAVPILAIQDCGGIGAEQIPNNTYGYGRVDAFNAILRTMDHKAYLPLVLFDSLEFK